MRRTQSFIRYIFQTGRLEQHLKVFISIVTGTVCWCQQKCRRGYRRQRHQEWRAGQEEERKVTRRRENGNFDLNKQTQETGWGGQRGGDWFHHLSQPGSVWTQVTVNTIDGPHSELLCHDLSFSETDFLKLPSSISTSRWEWTQKLNFPISLEANVSICNYS